MASRQRIRALEAFLDDVYGEGRAFADGVLPRRLVTTSQHFHRAAHGITPANGVRVHVGGIDLVRDEAGDLRVLEDNLRTPSGVSYVLENRRTMARVLARPVRWRTGASGVRLPPSPAGGAARGRARRGH